MLSAYSMLNFFVPFAYWWWFKWGDFNVALCLLDDMSCLVVTAIPNIPANFTCHHHHHWDLKT